VLAMLLATTISVGMLIIRSLFSGQVKFTFLPGNLVLAWIPLVFALIVYTMRARGSRRSCSRHARVSGSSSTQTRRI
jgi:uncharacterized membrane protein